MLKVKQTYRFGDTAIYKKLIIVDV